MLSHIMAVRRSSSGSGSGSGSGSVCVCVCVCVLGGRASKDQSSEGD